MPSYYPKDALDEAKKVKKRAKRGFSERSLKIALS